MMAFQTDFSDGNPEVSAAWGRRGAELIDAGFLLPLGQGIYGSGPRMEVLTSAVDRTIGEMWAAYEPEVRRFPPVLPVKVLEATGYVRSFPNLVGVVGTFDGDPRQHEEMVRSLHDEDDWPLHLAVSGAALCSAACHPLYPTIESPLDGNSFDISGWVYRNEPSLDPARMVAFRQHELVRVGSAADVTASRDEWLRVATTWLRRLGLEVLVEVAHDPFFGRARRLLAERQLEAEAKYEVLAATSGAGKLTAIGSANLHGEHFARAVGLRLADGSTATTGCLGLGIERVSLALLWRHGLDLDGWEAHVLGGLGL